jgi:hypothetical protein
MAKKQGAERGDAENTGFGFPEHLADHKPGFDHRGSEAETETGDSHRFRRSGKKGIPQESLAARIGKLRKGK